MQRPDSVWFAQEPVEVFLDESYGQILYFPQMKTIFVEMIGAFSHMQYRQVYTYTYELLVQLQACACIASQSRSFGSSFQDRSWLINHLVPLLSQAFPTPDFMIIGIKDSNNNTKRWIADFLERSLRLLAPFSVLSATSFDDAMLIIQERLSSDSWRTNDYRKAK
ncbi:MAG: hypothetical protein RMJ87_03775 [Cytophagales bacterium]|nr:hypothetical protein [Bernardetiaceae bacterium]MDW8204126.1 hypothetical protein [Cytophagales bacterium]